MHKSQGCFLFLESLGGIGWQAPLLLLSWSGLLSDGSMEAFHPRSHPAQPQIFTHPNQSSPTQIHPQPKRSLVEDAVWTSKSSGWQACLVNLYLTRRCATRPFPMRLLAEVAFHSISQNSLPFFNDPLHNKISSPISHFHWTISFHSEFWAAVLFLLGFTYHVHDRAWYWVVIVHIIHPL